MLERDFSVYPPQIARPYRPGVLARAEGKLPLPLGEGQGESAFEDVSFLQRKSARDGPAIFRLIQ
jgi:hypothetical protein